MLTQTGNCRESRVFRAIRDVIGVNRAQYQTHQSILDSLQDVYQSEDFKKLTRYNREYARGYIAHALDSFWDLTEFGYFVNHQFISCRDEKSSALLRSLDDTTICCKWKSSSCFYIPPKNFNFTFTEPVE